MSWNPVKGPSTPATRLLRDKGVAFTERLYRYEERGGTHLSAQALGVDDQQPLIVLMHGDREVSLKGRALDWSGPPGLRWLCSHRKLSRFQRKREHLIH